MLSQVKSMALQGVQGHLITIQVDISSGLPSWDVVGLPDISIKESKQRVKAALKNIGYELPSRKIIINLAPANIKKEGSLFDLPISLGILCDLNILDNSLFEDYFFIGELSLDGSLNKVSGVLPMCIEAYHKGIKKAIVPWENRFEASVIKDLEIYPAYNLLDVINHFQNNIKLKQFESNIDDYFSSHHNYYSDFSDVKGQEKVKRALEISAAGGHNCLLIGSPGSGKTMLASRIPSILPDLTFNESLEITKIHSITGIMPPDTPLITTRPFRSPHHTISYSAFVGGGKNPKPGEITLAHYGVLFLDEVPEFKKDILENLREPLENRQIIINRVSSSLTYPCNFILVGAMNPCPCGYFGSNDKECSCTPDQIKKYINKLSGPLLDRIDIHMEVSPVKYNDLYSERKVESSEEIKKRVNKARSIQLERYKNDSIFSNSELNSRLIKKYCKLDDESNSLLRKAFETLNLSARAHDKIIKLARTIADLDNSKEIRSIHVAEAITYRGLDRKYWK